VYLIDTVALGAPTTVAVYLLKGSKIALVDCGYASSYQEILNSMIKIGIQPSEVSYIVPTHVHLDHAGGTAYLLEHMPRAQVITQERGVPHLIDPSRLIQSATSVFGEETIKSYGLPRGVEKQRVTAVGEEMHLDLGGLSITAIHAPGHAPHQISILVEEEKLLLSADAVGIVYPNVPTMIPTTPPPSFDPVKLRETVNRLIQMDPKMLLVPHFGVRSDVLDVLEATKDKTDAWLLKVKNLKDRGMMLEEMVKKFQREIVNEAGIESEVPPYANLSIKVTLMGMLHYLQRIS
jgi:glyoxylase-like metal-dependent hydrolase (beta-lactamase superfamily II)